MTPSPRLRFDFVDSEGHAAPLVFERPERVIEARRIEDVRAVLDKAAAAQASGRFVAGFVSYEAAPAFDAALVTRAPSALPLVWFGVFAAPTSNVDSGATDAARPAPSIAPIAPWSADVTRAGYDEAVARVRDAIADGECYQANYTFRLRSRVDVDTLDVRYHELRRAQGVRYGAHLDIGRWQILSLSPELFFKLDGRMVITRPMKGTIGRGRFTSEDDERATTLHASAKNRAENVMIVDLMRNDLGRIAEIGSIEVPSLFDVETYPAVFQMTSTVSGRLRNGLRVPDVFAALFPAGSITGAPKTSSMRTIADLETAPRGLYCGAIGVMTPDGRAVFNVAIRTAVVDTTTGAIEYGVGGGITWDSTPSDEYAEALSKASFLDTPSSFALIETLRIDEGVFVRRRRHLDRMARSAAYFGFRFDRPCVDAALDAHAHDHPHGSRRARIELTRDGAVTVESQPFAPGRRAAEPPRSPVAPRSRAAAQPRSPVIALSPTPVSSRDVFLFHKTTRREVYDRARASHPDAFDVLLHNEHGELTEFTIGNLVIEIDGVRWTPPRPCGLLNGAFRDELLESGAIRERVLTRDDLTSASRVWLINSLREWVEVELR